MKDQATMDAITAEKHAAAVAAVALVEDGMAIGLGTGSTATLAIAELGARVQAGLSVVAIPTWNAAPRRPARWGSRSPISPRSRGSI